MSTTLEERRDRRSAFEGFRKSFGPGLLWAAAAIGVSHLVQATRAGATAGFALAGIIALALLLKYPFFEYGPRYAAATGRSLVEGYRNIGSWALWLYFVLTLVTSLIVQTAIIVFTAFLLQYILGVSWPLPVMAAILMAACAGLLWVGRFRLLDRVVKVILVVLALSTLIAAIVAAPAADLSTVALWPEIGGGGIALGFVLALAGWMPSAIDVSVWSSLWTLAKDHDSGRRATVSEATLDFDIGYVGTAILAFAFLLLGAAVMYGAGREFSPQGTTFSIQLVDLYTETLGAWLRPIVLAAVFTTMFSTSLTVVDGFPRALDRCLQNLDRRAEPPPATADVTRNYWIVMVALAVLTLLVTLFLIGSLTAMVDFAATFAFLTAPVLGYLNLRAVTSDDVPVEARPGRAMIVHSWVGLLLLGGTAVVYVITRFA